MIAPNKIKIWAGRKLGVKIGENVSIMNYCKLNSEPYYISIGSNTTLSVGVSFINHDGAIHVCETKDNVTLSKPGRIDIMENCFIGYNAILLPGIRIGPNSIIGAGSVVTKNVPENSVYAGNPARFIRSYDAFLDKCKNAQGTCQHVPKN